MTEPPVPDVISHYRILRLLGRGGMGSVYEAEDRRDETRVAIKFLRPELAVGDTTFRERFEREAHVAALLHSPYTVKLLDYGVEGGRLFLVMDYVDGQAVNTLLAEGPLAPARALKIARDVARALEEAEARGVVHRDIKPANVLVLTGDRVRVTDFGIARQLGDSSLTTPGGYVGTAEFAAPEQLEGRSDNRSDIYSLGATLFAMLTAEVPPFADPAKAAARLGSFPPAAVQLVTRCLQRDPAARYATARDLAGAIGRVLESVARGEPGGATAEFRPLPTPGEAPTVVDQRATLLERRPPPAAPAQAPALPPSPLCLRLDSMGRAGAKGETAVFDLSAENGGAATADALLSGAGDGCEVTTPATLSVAPHATGHARILVRASRRRWLGPATQRRFNVQASRPGGGPPFGTAEGSFEDVPDPRGRLAVLGVGGVALAGVVAAILAVSGVFGGGDSHAAPASSTATRTRTSAPTASAAPSRTATSQASPTASATTATATSAPIPARSIHAEEWDYTFTVVSNGCGGDPLPGRAFSYAYQYTEESTPADGYVSERELVKVEQLTDTGRAEIGDFVFTWPVFQFSYFIEGGKATLVNTFTDADTGVAELTEAYTLPNGDTCSIYLKDG